MAIKPSMKKNKTLPLYFLVDVSGSMRGDRIRAVNIAMEDVVTSLKKQLIEEELDVNYNLRVLTFGKNGVEYKYGTREKGIPLAEYEWVDIVDSECQGYTPMGECVEEIYEVFQDGVYPEYLGSRIAAPFVLLISDGEPTGDVDVKEASKHLFSTKLGNKSVCVSIGISVEDNLEAKANLEAFGKSGFAYGDGSEPEKLAQLIKLVTIASINTASTPAGAGSKDEENKKRMKDITFTGIMSE